MTLHAAVFPLGGEIARVCLCAAADLALLAMPGKRKTAESSSAGRPRAVPKRLSAKLLAKHDSETAQQDASPRAPPEREVKRRKTNQCASCNMKKGDVEFVPGMVDACANCFGAYCMGGFTMHGAWQSFCDKLEKDAIVGKKFEAALQMHRDKSKPSWNPQRVTTDNGMEIEVCQPMVGPSREQLVNLLGCAPEECGVRLGDLFDQSDKTFKGLLIPHPFRPFLEYNIKWRYSVGVSEENMPSSSQLYAEQAADSYNYIKKTKIDECNKYENLLAKSRTKPWDMQSLLEKAAEVRRQQGKGPPPGMSALLGEPAMAAMASGPMASGGTAPAPDAADPGGELQDGSDGEEVDEEPAVVPHMGPTLNFGAVLDSVSVMGSEANSRHGASGSECGRSVKGSRASPGAESIRYHLDERGVPASDEGKQDLVDKRIKSADIQKMFEPKAMGREIMWAKHARDLFRGANETKWAEILEDHVALCEHAEYLVNNSIMKMPKPKLTVAVRALQEAGHELPSKIKSLLFKRYVTTLQDNYSVENVKLFLDAVLPWRSAAPEDSHEEFDGLKPKLCLMEGSVLDLTSQFQACVCV